MLSLLVQNYRDVRLIEEEKDLLETYRKIKNQELRGCILKLIGNVNKRVK